MHAAAMSAVNNPSQPSRNKSEFHMKSKQSGTNLSKSVNFGSIRIREYALTEGDNTQCRYPVSLDWQHGERDMVVNIDLYEAHQARLGRRTGQKIQKTDELDRKCRLKLMGVFDERSQQSELDRRPVRKSDTIRLPQTRTYLQRRFAAKE